MTEITNPSQSVYFLAYNASNNNAFRLGKVNAGEAATTNEPDVEQFLNSMDWINRAMDFGITINVGMGTMGIVNPDADCYFLAYNNEETICHYGKTMTINVTETGQVNIEKFMMKSAWITRAAELGTVIDPDTEVEQM